MNADPPVRLAPSGPRFAPFWAGCREGRLLITRCAVCGAWHWYPPLGCSSCGGQDLVWSDAGRTGVVFSYTVAHRSFLPPGDATVPYPVAIVELDDAPGVRLVSDLVDLAGVPPAVGLRVGVDFRIAGEHVLPVFAPRHPPGGD